MSIGGIKVLIADDSYKAREGLRDLISTWPEIELVGEVSDGSEVLPFLYKHDVDVVIIDVRMPGIDGVTATQQITKLQPNVAVIVSSLYPYSRGEAIEAGAQAFFVKGDSPNDLRAAVRAGSRTG